MPGLVAGSGFWSVVELDGRAALLDDVESAMFLSGAMPVGSMGGRGRTVQMEMAERPAQRGGIEQAATSGKTPTVSADRYYFRAGENGSGSHGAMMGRHVWKPQYDMGECEDGNAYPG